MMRKLEQKIVGWAEEKDIFEKATQDTQFTKLLEEVEELRKALFEDEAFRATADEISDAGEFNLEFEDMKVAEELGDCAVVLTILAQMRGLSLQDCVAFAYKKISKRTGKMVDGFFVKDNDTDNA